MSKLLDRRQCPQLPPLDIKLANSFPVKVVNNIKTRPEIMCCDQNCKYNIHKHNVFKLSQSKL